MTEKERIYHKYLEALKVKLIAKYDALGLRASGRYAQELDCQACGDKLTVWAPVHAIFMEKGRRAGGFPPRKAIAQWIEVKQGLPRVFKEKKKQYAFLIARKIAREGIRVPNAHNKGHVVSEVVEDFLGDQVHRMLDELGLVWLSRIKSDILGILKAT